MRLQNRGSSRALDNNRNTLGFAHITTRSQLQNCRERVNCLVFTNKQGMFDKATKKLLHQIDPDGFLIPASLNDSKKLKLLAVVLKKPKRLFRKDKYIPTPFTLSNLLTEGEIHPVGDETDFVKCKATYKSDASASMEMGNKSAGLNVGGKGSSKLSLSLEKLKREDVDIPKLMKDTQGRQVKYKHSLIQQAVKRKMVLSLLTERIFTPCECSILYTGQRSCSSSLNGSTEILSVKGKGDLQYESDVVLTVPQGTVIAYRVLKMNISSDGYFDLCFGPDDIEADDASLDCSDMDDAWDLQEIEEGSSFSSLKAVFPDVQTRLCVLANMSSETRSSLLLHLRKILLDRPSLSALVETLETQKIGQAPLLPNEFLDNPSYSIGEVLDLLKDETHNRSGMSAESANHSEQILIAVHMLLSAIEEMTDDGLQLLESFCCPEGLRSLHDLVNTLMANSEPLPKHAMPVFLQKEDEFNRMVELFKSCNVSLEKENKLFAEICEKGFLPLVLCIAVSGLACLIDGE